MRIRLFIECDCGNSGLSTLSRRLEVFEGKTYEDYSSITDSEFDENRFSTSQTCPDVIDVLCAECGKSHELIT